MLQTKGVANFDEEELNDLYFNYKSSEKKFHDATSIQTEEIKYSEASTMTKKSKNSVEIQVQESDFLEESEMNPSLNQKDIIDFLQRTVPLVLENYEVKWNEKVSENRCLYTLYNKNNHIYEKDNELQFTDIAWNSTGLILAISLGKFDHDGACQDKSFVYLWNINRRDFKPDNPTFVIETTSCIMSLTFHPKKPSFLIGGSFNGEIFLWDISKKDDYLISSSNLDEYFHREAITHFSWVEQQKELPGLANIHYNLISLSTDGKLLIWNMKYEDKSENTLLSHPIKGYSLLRKKDTFVSNVGGLSFSQSCEDKNTFIIGTEAGSVLRAQILSISFEKKQRILFEQKSEVSKNIKWKEESIPFMVNLNQKVIPEIKHYVEEYAKNKGINEILPKHIFASKPEIRKIYPNPIISAFEPHMGPTYCVNFSPFHRNLFLSCSLDGSIKIYDLLQSKAILTFENGNNYIFKALWSPNRPCVFAACSSDGDLLFYDVSSSCQNIILKINADENGSCLNFEFNKKQTDLMAIAYSKNRVKIIQLCDKLTSPIKDEMSYLNLLFE